MRLILMSALLALSLNAQRTKTEVMRPTTPADDTKANDPAVPDVVAVSGQFEKVMVFRFKYQADILAGLEAMVKQHKIRNAVILAGVGSVRNYHIHSVSNRTFPSRNTFLKDASAPADIVGMNGYIMDGKIHAHMTMTNEEGAFGGHLESGTNVFTFAMITVGVLTPSADLSKFDDKTWR